MFAPDDFRALITRLPTLQLAQIESVSPDVPLDWTLQLGRLEVERVALWNEDPVGWDLFTQVRPLKDRLEEDGRLAAGEWGVHTFLPNLLARPHEDQGFVSSLVRTAALLDCITDTYAARELANQLVFEQLVTAAQAYASPTASTLSARSQERVSQFLVTAAGLLGAELPPHLPPPGIAVTSPNALNFIPPGASKTIPVDMVAEELTDAFLRGLLLQRLFEPFLNRLDSPLLDLEGTEAEQAEILNRRRSFPHALWTKGLFQHGFAPNTPLLIKQAVLSAQHFILLSGLRVEAAMLRGCNKNEPLPDWALREPTHERTARLQHQKSVRKQKYLTTRYNAVLIRRLFV